MTFSADRLDRECRVFHRYLAACDPDAYVLTKYREGHRAPHWIQRTVPDRFDALLLNRAVRGPFMARLADAYACFFFRRAVLRQKLVLLLAIVESRTPAFGALENPPQRNAAGPFIALAFRGAAFSGLLACAVATFAPAHLRLRRGSPASAKARIHA